MKYFLFLLEPIFFCSFKNFSYPIVSTRKTMALKFQEESISH